MPSTVLNTRTESPERRLQQGQAIILIALLILVLFGMLGLAVDSGRGYVDRRDQQAAVDAAALAAGDWYENYSDLNLSITNSVNLYQRDLRLYNGYSNYSHPATQYVGPNNNLPQDTYTYDYNTEGYELVIVATNTQFNGYQFTYTTTHNLPLAFMQIFGGGPTIQTSASASSIVGNQRQTPALLTLSTDRCSMNLTGSAQLTVLGDVYSNGQACLDSNLHEAGNCYGAASSNCGDAQYYCYNSTPGFVPYPPPCAAGDTQGTGIVPAPTLPDPGYLASSVPYYTTGQAYNEWNRGTWTEMFPGTYTSAFHLTGGAASCAFLDPGVYNWQAGYTSDATGSLLSNELRPPDEQLWSAPFTSSTASPQFWNQNGVNAPSGGPGCAGHFTVSNGLTQTVTTGPTCTDLSPITPNPCHSGVTDTLGRNNRWGVVLTSVRFDQFLDPNMTPRTCYPPGSCKRESAPSACQTTPNAVAGNLHTPSPIGITINITRNAPGAQYYNVYLDPKGCTASQADWGWVGRFDAPGFSNGTPGGPYPNGTPWALGASAPLLPPPGGASVYDINDTQISNPATPCYSQVRVLNCMPTDNEQAPQCLANCPPPANLLSQEVAPMSLQSPPYTGGDEANENYCQPSVGTVSTPCLGSQVTPGGVQFYFPNGSCFGQNAQGATYVYAGVQFNWIVIYAPASNTCNETMNGGAATQYIGTIYTPGADWSISGGDRSPLAGQVICYTASVSGGGQAGIDFNPNYSPVPPAARLIN
jgi:Putative Flp pilus-assembly TadE/G-like